MNKNCDNLTHKNFLFGRIIIFVTHMKTKNSPAVFSGTNLFKLEIIFTTRPLGGISDDKSIKTDLSIIWKSFSNVFKPLFKTFPIEIF